MSLFIPSIDAPLTRTQGSLSERAARVVAATLVLAVAAHLAFPLPFTPVPLTLQPLAVLAVGLLLGPLDGAAALLVYLAEGAVGLPVFSPTGPGGLPQLLGPTGGFLLADPVVALVAAYGARHFTPRMGRYAAACVGCTLGVALLFGAGAAWLAYLQSISLRTVWTLAVAPFLPGELVKILLAAGIYRTFSSHFEG